MHGSANLVQWILGILLIITSLGLITARKPIYSSLAFLMTLLLLAAFYLQLSAQFIAVMQILVYAGAILVIFMFVIVLFQDAHEQLSNFKPQSWSFFLYLAATFFVLTLGFLATRFFGLVPTKQAPPHDFGTVQALGEALYVDFFFPFEAVILLFLVAGIGALYIAKKEK